MKWFGWVLCVAFICELAQCQEPLTPVPDTGGDGSEVDCDALARQIEELESSITRTEARIAFVEAAAELEIAAIDQCNVEYLAAQARGAEPFELIEIHSRSFGHWMKLEGYQAEIKEIDAKLADLKFRWIMAVLQHMMECG